MRSVQALIFGVCRPSVMNHIRKDIKDLVTVPGSVRVQWDHKPKTKRESVSPGLTAEQQRAHGGLEPDRNEGGFVNVYRYGAEGKYDVRVVDQTISPVDWESVIQQMPDRDYVMSGANGAPEKVDKHGFRVANKGTAGKGSYHSQVLTHQADRDALAVVDGLE